MNPRILRDLVILFLALVSLATECNKEPVDNPKLVFGFLKFTVDPELGTTNTTFTFTIKDAYYLDKFDDKRNFISFKWDFDYTGEGDVVWDTEALKDKTITHQYTNPGTFNVRLRAKGGLESESEIIYKDVTVAPATNTPPHPILTIEPDQGYPHEFFTFNAMLSWDNEHNDSSLLKLRWDYNTDNIFELDWGTWDTMAIIHYRYDTPGEYTVTLEAKDTEGLVGSVTETLNVVDYVYDIPCLDEPTVFYEGKTYNTVYIVDQCWLSENLDVGMRLDYGINSSNNGQIEKYCYHNKDAFCDKYGAMYQWNEIMNYLNVEGGRGICPQGWHIPTFDDISKLHANLNYFGTFSHPDLSGTNVGKQIQHPDNNCDGEYCQDLGQSGFDFLLGGASPDPTGQSEGKNSWFWTSTEASSINARYVGVYHDYHLWHSIPSGANKSRHAYVRCIKD